MDYIANNPKDFFNICFWILTGFLAIITYRNAKKTLFNPIRSEMVKYQMKIITEFIDKYTARGLSFDNSIDYINLLKINYETDYLFDILTNEFNFDKHQFDEIDSDRLMYCTQNLGGLIEITNSQNDFLLEFVSGDFEMAKKYIQTKFIKEKELNNNQLILQRFYLTTKFYSFYSDLLNLKSNPFTPKKIKATIEAVVFSLEKNIIILYKLLCFHIPKQTDGKYQDIYHQFNMQRINHHKELEDLRKNISNYFKVNTV